MCNCQYICFEYIAIHMSRAVRKLILAHLVFFLIFYPGSEILILPMLSYLGYHKRTVFIGCIATHAHGCQVTSMVSQSDVIVAFQRIQGLMGLMRKKRKSSENDQSFFF